MMDSQSTGLSSANADAQITHVQMVNTNLPVPPEGTTLPRQLVALWLIKPIYR